jgi:peptidoglycan/xylan/chitin deacetylase (PgdA/CDA1 family)
MLPSHNRYTYSAITERPVYDWPGGKRLAVYIGLNLEHFAFGEGLGGELAPGGPQPDVLNYAWRDYGNRVGVWRMLELFEQLDLPVSLLVNSEIYDYCPQVIEAFRKRGDEIVAHGRTNAERQGTMAGADEAALIAGTTETIRRHEGKAPAGWLGPWISQSRLTPDLLQEQGYKYLLDWCHDDQPTWFRTRNGRILSVPYSQEINDIPAIMVRRTSATEFATMIIDQFDEMREQSQQQPLVLGIALHAYIVGQPFRLRALRRALEQIAQAKHQVWLTPAGAVAEHIYAAPERAV